LSPADDGSDEGSMRALALILAFGGLCLTATRTPAADSYDVWIRGGSVLDGSGGAAVAADVLIRGDRIVKVGAAPGANARQIIDATGKVVAPGFIDTHSHGDPLIDASFENFALQGVTTVLLGQDGSSPGYDAEAPAASRKSLPEWMGAVEQAKLQTNVATLVGHGTLRLQTGVDISPTPTQAQIAMMQQRLAEALDAGAFGLSSGLEYVPGRYAPREELVALARTVGAHKGFVVSHLRSEDADKVVDAVDELLEQGRHAQVHVSHLKIVFAKSAAEGERVLSLLEAARRQGVAVTADVYPYLAGYGDLSLVYPPWAKTRAEWDRAVGSNRAALETYLRERIALRGGPEAILLAEAPYTNRTLAQVAQEAKLPAERVVIDVLGYGGPSAAHFNMRADVQDRFLSWQHASIATDGGPTLQHPRSWGTYPKVLEELVRTRKLISLPDAVRKMTSLPAAIVGLEARGRIAAGNVADIVVFDRERVRATATWDRFAQAPEGVAHVLVNGCVQVEDGRMTANACGRLLRSTREAELRPKPSTAGEGFN
jgi:N-acyl-D-amino-acid deacylase